MSHVFLRVGGAFLASVCAFSFSDTNNETDAVLDTVHSDFVSAADTQPEFITSPASIILPASFSANDLTVADVIEQSPSVQLQQTGELGSYANISVRGAPSQQTQIFVDGVLQSNVGGEGGYLQLIPLNQVAQIEVYPGSVPTQFSQSSPGGAINIVRKTSANFPVKLTAEVGSFERKRFAGLATGTLQKTQWSVFAERTSAKNNFEYLKDNGTPLYEGDDALEERENAHYQSSKATVLIKHNTQNTSAHFAVDAVDNHKALPHWNNHPATDTFYDQRFYSVTSGIDFNQWRSGVDSSFRITAGLKEGHFNDPDNQIGIQANDSNDQLLNRQLQHHSVLASPFGLVSLANEIQQAEFSIQDERLGTTLDAERNALNTSLGGEFFVGDELMLATTVRYSHHQDVTSESRQQNQRADGHIGLRLDRETWVGQWNAQSTTRAPTLIERFGNWGTFEGNPDLKYERGYGTDVSLKLGTENAQLQPSLYLRHTQDAIAAVYNSQGIGRYINLDRALYFGLEWQAHIKKPSLSFMSTGSLQQGISYSDLAIYDRRQVPGFYPVSTTQSLLWQAKPNVNMRLNYLYESGLFFDRANSTRAPDKHQFDINLSGNFAPFTVSFELKNLFNRAHVDFSRMPLPGRSVVLTLEYTFGD